MSAQDDNPWQWRGGELAQEDGPRHWLSITYGIERVRHLEELAWRTRSSGLFEAKPFSFANPFLRCRLPTGYRFPRSTDHSLTAALQPRQVPRSHRGASLAMLLQQRGDRLHCLLSSRAALQAQADQVHA